MAGLTYGCKKGLKLQEQLHSFTPSNWFTFSVLLVRDYPSPLGVTFPTYNPPWSLQDSTGHS